MAPLRTLLQSLAFINPTSVQDSDAASPTRVFDFLSARDLGTSNTYDPGHSSWNPHDIHNAGFFFLFALIGVAFVISAIWFFFWAKNGGFHFHKGDWDEYKSTVLRRKGPDGKTLSNATKSTKLGGGSVMGSDYTDRSATSYQDSEVGTESSEKPKRARRKHKKANKYDADVREYRSEKPARVGGLNKIPDGTGSVHDWSTAASNLSSQPAMSEVSRSEASRSEVSRSEVSRSTHHRQKSRAGPSRSVRRDFSFNHGSEASFSAVSSDVSSNAPLRPPQQARQASQRHSHAPTATADRHHQQHRREQPSSSSAAAAAAAANPKQYQANRARRSQGFYATRASEGSYADPIDFHDAAASVRSTSEIQAQNTKVYKHSIAGLSKGSAAPSTGFRRGGGGRRRDSLSDSDDGESYRS